MRRSAARAGGVDRARRRAAAGPPAVARAVRGDRRSRGYPLTRIGEAPRKIHVELIASDGPPGGVGEPGVPPVAPAILNAVFALTGQRVRTLPLVRAPVVSPA